MSRPPLTTLIHGGLGNQLFCYAAARGLSTLWDRECYLDIETGYQRDRFDRSYRLHHFPIQAKIAPHSLNLGGNTHTLRHRLTRIFSRYQAPESRTYLTEKKSFAAREILALQPTTSKPIYLNGYWQDLALFKHIENEIRTELTPPAPISPAAVEMLAKISQTSNSTFLHIRRERYYPELLLPHSYYENRISQILQRFPDAHFFIFGDDFPWAKQINFQSASHTFCENIGANEIEDLALMVAAQHAIIAPSSFSWWAAWLGKKNHQTVWLPPQYGLSHLATPTPEHQDDTSPFFLD